MISILSDAYKAIVKHNKLRDWNYPMGIYITLAHIAAVFGIWKVPQCNPLTLLWAFLLWPITGLGITAGVHRLWSHRSYDATFLLRFILMLLNSIANQGSIWHWSRDHRVHHKFSETDADPHNATRGFFFAHMGWLFVKKHPRVVEAGKQLNFDDLANDWCVVVQKQLDPWFALFMCFVFPAIVSTHWGENFWNGFFVAGALRYIWVLHATWLVNSAAHLYGDHPYDEKSWPAENPMVSVAAIGEGWHNWHHKYPFDYAASEFGVSEQYNPTKMFIDTCVFLGLASNPKRATGAWNKLKSRKELAMYGADAQEPGSELKKMD
jgi:stearoyl-CoA desaturase (Delta-9 desaturase)